MTSGQDHYCEVGGKGKVLSANPWVWVGYVVRSADREGCLPPKFDPNLPWLQPQICPLTSAYR